MEVDAMEEEEINEEAEEEVEMADKDYAKLKNKVVKPKKRVAGKAGPELSLEEELVALSNTVRRRRKPKKSVTDDVKQSSERPKHN
jgi:hypothetical protein